MRKNIIKFLGVTFIIGMAFLLSGCIRNPMSCSTTRDARIYIKEANDIFSVQPKEVCICDQVYIENQTDENLLIVIKDIFGHDKKVSIGAGQTGGPYLNAYKDVSWAGFTITRPDKRTVSGTIMLRCAQK